MMPPPQSPGVPGHDAKTPPELSLLDSRDLMLLRHGPDRNAAYGRLHERCREHMLGGPSGRTLSPEDGESLVAQAVFGELAFLLDPRLDAATVSSRLRTALDRARVRHLRERSELESTLSALASLGGDERPLSTPLQIARELDAFLGQALDLLGTEDRDLLSEEYGLGRFGFDVRGQAPPTVGFAGLGARRARKHFRLALDQLLTDAIAEHDRAASLLVRLREIVRNPAFFHVLAGSSHGSL